MLISFDSRAFFLSKINKLKKELNIKNSISDFNFSFLGEGSGPQNFLSDLINAIEYNNLAKTTYNFLKSDLHLLNYGFYSPIWKKFNIKPKKNILLRLDGVVIDSDNINEKKIKYNFSKIVNKSEFIIYQSIFCKNCFENTYSDLPLGKVINNGAAELPIASQYTQKIIANINKFFKNKYFTVAGRFTNRKRIAEVICQFNENKLGNLVVLSNVPKKLQFNNERILYLGLLNKNTARHIIANSLALVHFDKYDWCPNLVISSIKDGTPVICSNFGGTPEVTKGNGMIIEEFPKDLPATIEGINIVKKAVFPTKMFKEHISLFKRKDFLNSPNSFYDINRSALEYIKVAKYLIRN